MQKAEDYVIVRKLTCTNGRNLYSIVDGMPASYTTKSIDADDKLRRLGHVKRARFVYAIRDASRLNHIWIGKMELH